MVERPGVKLFPWSKSDDEWWLSITDAEGAEEGQEATDPWLTEDRFKVAKTVGYTLDSTKITISAFLAVIGISIWIIGFAVDVFTIDFGLGDDLRNVTNPISYSALAISLLLMGLSYTSVATSVTTKAVTNPLSLLPPSTKRGVAELSLIHI